MSRLRGLIRRRKIERETEEELRFHVEMETEANRARGLSPEEARRVALRDLGGVTQTRDAVRRMRTMWFDALWQDLRYSLRGLARSPGYVTTTVLGLGVGLTAAIVMFSVLSTVFHGDPIGVADRDSLARVRVAFVDNRGNTHSASVAQFQEFRRPSPAIPDMTAMSVVKVTLRYAADAISVPGAIVSDTFFQVLGTRAAAGRLLAAADDRNDSDAVVLGFRTWQRWFAGSADAIGQAVLVGDRSMRIIGVAPDRFTGTGSWLSGGLDPPQVWIPASAAGDLSSVAKWYAPVLGARLGPGVTRERALAELTARTRALVADESPGERRIQVHVMDFVLGELGENGWLMAGFVTSLMTVPTLLLLLGCANVANLRLARATARTRELAVRVALGATRGQVVRLILTEAAVLGAGALMASWLGTQALIRQLGEPFLDIPVRIDPGVVAFSLTLAAAAVGLSGLAPAWLVTRRATASDLKQTGKAGGAGHARLRNTLVIAQVAVSVLLLSVGSLLMRALQTRHDAVRDPGPVVMADLDLKSQGYDVARATAFASALSERLGADARTAHVGFSEFPYLRSASAEVRVLGATTHRALLVSTNRVTPGWFGAVDLPATAGRVFSPGDAADVAVVSSSLARQLAPGGSPIGIRVTVSGLEPGLPATHQVIGVVPDESAEPPRPGRPSGSMYVPLKAEMPVAFSVFIRARSSDEVHTLVPLVNRLIASVAPSMPWTIVETTSDVLGKRTSDSRSLALIVSSAGLVGLLLSAAGLFAVMSYTVSLRTREIGVRVALGGRPTDLVRLVMLHAARLTVLGAFIGLSLSIPLAFVLRSALFGVSPLDPVALAGTIGLLLLTAVAASAVPALRAARTSPLVALRAE